MTLGITPPAERTIRIPLSGDCSLEWLCNSQKKYWGEAPRTAFGRLKQKTVVRVRNHIARGINVAQS
jgi:hypothetical protein